MYNGQTLSTAEKNIAIQCELNVANIDKNAKPAVHLVNARTLENEAHPMAARPGALSPALSHSHSESRDMDDRDHANEMRSM